MVSKQRVSLLCELMVSHEAARSAKKIIMPRLPTRPVYRRLGKIC